MRDYESACHVDGVPTRASFADGFENTSQDARVLAARATDLAGRLVGFYPPKADAVKTNSPEPSDTASRLLATDGRMRVYLRDIVDALDAIEARLA